jgi:hypothetical protein
MGALSVATANAVERGMMERAYPFIAEETDEAERRVRLTGADAPENGGGAPGKGKAGTVCGFLLRSAAVAGWPGMHVRAYASDPVPGGDDEALVAEDNPRRLRLLRLERLAPAVLLAMFDGVPEVLHLEEPRQGLQFGVRVSSLPGPGKRTGASIPLRDRSTGGYVNVRGRPAGNSQQARQVPVKFRKGAPGVLNLKETANALTGLPGSNLGPSLDGAEFALEMLRFPYRQVFAGSETDATRQDAAFKPTVQPRAADYLKALERALQDQ